MKLRVLTKAQQGARCEHLLAAPLAAEAASCEQIYLQVLDLRDVAYGAQADSELVAAAADL